jgi:hypothetical protein
LAKKPRIAVATSALVGAGLLAAGLAGALGVGRAVGACAGDRFEQPTPVSADSVAAARIHCVDLLVIVIVVAKSLRIDFVDIFLPNKMMGGS